MNECGPTIDCTQARPFAVFSASQRQHSRLGAVNTLAIRDGRMFGYNTDGPGFLASVKEGFGIEVAGLRVLVLGAGGGAGRAVAVQCALAGARVILANRTQAKAEQVRAEIAAMSPAFPAEIAPEVSAEAVAAADMIVNATPLGMKGADMPLIPPGSLQARHLVYDMVYRADGDAPQIAAARASGARWIDGLNMLLHQGAISFEHWFGPPAPLDAMRAGLLGAVAERT